MSEATVLKTIDLDYLWAYKIVTYFTLLENIFF